ncbi:hypothetical protein ACSQ67_017864 [Phaseolus vulgaris]
MGCASSKLDDLPAVALCRDRCVFLDEAIHQRYALAAAHIAYINSLKAIDLLLLLPLRLPLPLTKPTNSPSTLLPPTPIPAAPTSTSTPNPMISTLSTIPPNPPPFVSPLSTTIPTPGSPPPSHQLHEEQSRPFNSLRAEATQSPNGLPRRIFILVLSLPLLLPLLLRSLFSTSLPRIFPTATPTPAPPRLQAPSTSPSPPRASTWDFLNFFDNSDDKYYPQAHYTPSRDSRELREEEGIPDLEDEEYHHEVVKQVHGDQKLVDAKPEPTLPHHNHLHDEEEEDEEEDEDEVEYEVHVVDKKVVDADNDGSNKPKDHAAFRSRRPGSRNPLEVAKEIQDLFQRASDSGALISKILEVGKLPHNRKHAAYQASSKMLQVVSPSLSLISSQPSTSKDAESASNMGLDVDLTSGARNLSSTLHKLLLWEKKLYNEVKAEEKMRVIHDRKCRKLKRMDDRGADFHKVDATRTLIRSLSTKIRMAIQVVDKISVTINKIRDEELWPLLKELIQGLTRMWKSMLECHHNQCEAIREARILGSVGSRIKSGDSHLQATKQLEQELINWTFQFSGWISAQKGYVRALNNWLLKCLLYEPEETPDGIVPFSPGRIGAPQIFVICNQWSQALDRISEKEVVESMHVFTMSVLQIWEQDKLEMHRQVNQNKDLERKVRNIDRDDQKLQKQIQALERKVVLLSGEGKGLSVSENIIYQSDKSSSLQASLQRIFEAMERFTDESVRAYEELLQRSEEESAARNRERVS